MHTRLCGRGMPFYTDYIVCIARAFFFWQLFAPGGPARNDQERLDFISFPR